MRRGGDLASRRADRRRHRSPRHRRAVRGSYRFRHRRFRARLDDGDDGSSRSARCGTSARGASCSMRSAARSSQIRNEGGIADEVMNRVLRDIDLEDCAARRLSGRLSAARRLLEHAPAGRPERAQVQAHGAVGDPLDVVRELLRHRRLVAAAAPARSPSGRGARRAAASTRAAPLRARSKKRGRIGRGPTKLMSPRRTFQSCGSSSSCVAQPTPDLRDLDCGSLDESRRGRGPGGSPRRASACGTCGS